MVYTSCGKWIRKVERYNKTILLTFTFIAVFVSRFEWFMGKVPLDWVRCAFYSFFFTRVGSEYLPQSADIDLIIKLSEYSSSGGRLRRNLLYVLLIKEGKFSETLNCYNSGRNVNTTVRWLPRTCSSLTFVHICSLSLFCDTAPTLF